jgi:uncharacterized membrane protein
MVSSNGECAQIDMRTLNISPRTLYAAVLASVTAFVSPAAHSQSYIAQVLTMPAGMQSFHGAAMNDHGLVATWAYTPTFEARGFIYDTAVSTTAFTAVTPPSGLETGHGVHGVNNLGHMAGGGNNGVFGRGAFWASATGSGVPLGTLGGDSSSAVAINNHDVMVGSSNTIIPSLYRPVMYRDGNVIDVSSWAISGGAYDISDNGLIVGYANLGGQSWRAVWFDHGNGRVVDLAPDRTGSSKALAVNEWGIAVGSSSAMSGQYASATVFDMFAGTYIDIGRDSGFQSSEAKSINELNQVVGILRNDLATSVFVWDAATGLRYLDTLIPAGIHLTDVSAINNAGQILATSCQDSSQRDCSVVLLSPVPEPAIPALLSVGIGLLTLLRPRIRS